MSKPIRLICSSKHPAIVLKVKANLALKYDFKLSSLLLPFLYHINPQKSTSISPASREWDSFHSSSLINHSPFTHSKSSKARTTRNHQQQWSSAVASWTGKSTYCEKCVSARVRCRGWDYSLAHRRRPKVGAGVLRGTCLTDEGADLEVRKGGVAGLGWCLFLLSLFCSWRAGRYLPHL